MKIYQILLISLLGTALLTAQAENLSKAEEAKLRAKISSAQQALNAKFNYKETVQIGEISKAPIAGLYQAELNGAIVYYDADAKWLISGNMINLKTGEDFTEKARDKVFSKHFHEVFKGPGSDKYVAFSPKGKSKAYLNIFTDSDCFYCQKLHKEVPALNKAGVEVRYYLYPRSGLGSSTARELESVWCAANQQEAMNKVKARQQIPYKSCPNPLKEHQLMANKLGLRGTPFIITNKGKRIPGYMTAAKLIATLEADK